MEHFTALLAEQLLDDEHFVRQADPEMIKIWQWHALEELEHKSVAYDVYELIGNSRTERVAAALASMVGRFDLGVTAMATDLYALTLVLAGIALPGVYMSQRSHIELVLRAQEAPRSVL